MSSSDERYKRIADWLAVKAAGGDAGRRPAGDDFLQPSGATGPPVIPVRTLPPLRLFPERPTPSERAAAVDRVLERARRTRPHR